MESGCIFVRQIAEPVFVLSKSVAELQQSFWLIFIDCLGHLLQEVIPPIQFLGFESLDQGHVFSQIPQR